MDAIGTRTLGNAVNRRRRPTNVSRGACFCGVSCRFVPACPPHLLLQQATLPDIPAHIRDLSVRCAYKSLRVSARAGGGTNGDGVTLIFYGYSSPASYRVGVASVTRCLGRRSPSSSWVCRLRFASSGRSLFAPARCCRRTTDLFTAHGRDSARALRSRRGGAARAAMARGGGCFRGAPRGRARRCRIPRRRCSTSAWRTKGSVNARRPATGTTSSAARFPNDANARTALSNACAIHAYLEEWGPLAETARLSLGAPISTTSTA